MAKRFTFRLKTVGKLRKQQADQHRRIVAKRLGEIGGVQRRLDRTHELIRETHDTLRRLPAGQHVDAGSAVGRADFDLEAVRRHQVYLTQLHWEVADARGSLSNLMDTLRVEQAALAQASRRQKVLEKLEQRQRERYERALDRVERIEADEVAARCFRWGAGWSGLNAAEGSQG
ncbi:MAG: flagellar export protein FliJ [Phycisphaerae bacterium]